MCEGHVGAGGGVGSSECTAVQPPWGSVVRGEPGMQRVLMWLLGVEGTFMGCFLSV